MKVSLVAAAATVALLSACGSGGSGSSPSTTPTADGASPNAGSSTPTSLVVGVVPSTNVAPLYLGAEKGFFKEAGLDLEIQLAQGFAANVASVTNGETQIGFGTTVPIVGAIANGVPIRLVANSDVLDNEKDDISGLFAPKGSSITSLKDLEGKTVGVNALSNLFDVSLKAAMAKAGADPSTVKFLEVALPDMVAALDTKRVDAAAMGEPFVTLARAAGNVELPKPLSAGFDKGTPIASYFVSSRWAGEHAKEVKAFQDALAKSSDYANANPEEARAIMSTYTKIPADTLAKVTLGTYSAALDSGGLKTLTDLMVSTGTLPKAPAVDELVVQ